MADTILSPRLTHLLIREDRRVGERIVSPTTLDSLPSPSDSPTSSSHDTAYLPLHAKLPPSLSPPLPSPRMGQQPGSTIFGLLNNLQVGSPPSPTSGSLSPRDTSALPPTQPMQRDASTPMSAPLSSTELPPFFSARDQHRPSVDVVPTTTAPRPDMYRRHSSHPYEVNPVTKRIVYREFDFSPIGSRTPISRTTKACNACRARKVRCDAGGHPNLGQGGTGEPGTCSRCREAGVECAYSGVQKKRGPCPGASRPSIAARRQSQAKYIATPPPELSPPGSGSSISFEPRTSYDSRASYGFPPYEPEYMPLPSLATPRTSVSMSQSSMSHPLMSVPHSVPLQRPGSQSSSGWSSSHPRPLTGNSAALPLRRPTTGGAAASRKPSIVSWHPDDIPEERRGSEQRGSLFEQEYSMYALAEAGARRASEAEWGHGRRPSEPVTPLTPMSSAFGGDGRSLPPLSVALGRSGYIPHRD